MMLYCFLFAFRHLAELLLDLIDLIDVDQGDIALSVDPLQLEALLDATVPVYVHSFFDQWQF